MKINTDTNSVNSQISSVRKQQEQAMKQLITGLKINSADDAAGLQISNRLSNQASGTQVAIRNANDGYSLASVAESALSGISDAAGRINELSLQAANGSLSSADREAIQQEISQIQQQVGDIQTFTSFGGQSLFTSSSDRQFQVGADANTTIGLSLPDFTDVLGELKVIDVTTEEGAQAAIETSQNIGEYVDSVRGQIGAFQNSIESSINNLNNQFIQTEASRSRIQDTDFAQATADNTQASILSNIGLSVHAQANVSNQQALSLLN